MSELGKEEEKDWLQNVKELLWREERNHHGTVFWAAYRALQATLTLHRPAIIALLPMFVENAHLLAMIKHSMDVIRAAVHHVNPAQIPVIRPPSTRPCLRWPSRSSGALLVFTEKIILK